MLAICQVTWFRRLYTCWLDTGSGSHQSMNWNSIDPRALAQVASVENESRYRKASREDSPPPVLSGMGRPVWRSQ